MLEREHATDVWIRDGNGILHPQWPTAFADDLLTYAATVEMQQKQADIVSFFCMMTGLKMEPKKTIARALNAKNTETQEVLLYQMDGTQVGRVIQDMDSGPNECMRYLGIYLDIDGAWTGQHQRLSDKVNAIATAIKAARASSNIKWYAMTACGYSAITYPIKFAPWTLEEIQELLRPLNATLRNLSGYMNTVTPHIMYGDRLVGCLDLVDLSTRVQREKHNMVQRAQEAGGAPAVAIDALLTRVAQYNAIPHINASTIALYNLDEQEMKGCTLWASSLVSYINKAKQGLMKVGINDWDTINERVPRPIHNLPKAKIVTGPVYWTRNRDIMTKADLLAGYDPVRRWTQFAVSEEEPVWLRAYLRRPIPEGVIRLREGMMFIMNMSTVVEYIGFHPDAQTASVREWRTPPGVELNDGVKLTTDDGYRGMAGTKEVRIATLLGMNRILFTMIGPQEMMVRD